MLLNVDHKKIMITTASKISRNMITIEFSNAVQKVRRCPAINSIATVIAIYILADLYGAGALRLAAILLLGGGFMFQLFVILIFTPNICGCMIQFDLPMLKKHLVTSYWTLV